MSNNQTAQLIIRQSAHDYLQKSYVLPAKELQLELERHKRQKKDGATPQELRDALRGEGEGEQEEGATGEQDGAARRAGDCRPPPTPLGAWFNADVEKAVHDMRANREAKEAATEAAKAAKKQQARDKAVTDGVLHHEVMAILRDGEPLAALQYFLSVEAGSLKRLLTHL